MSVEYSIDLYYGCQIDGGYYNTILDIVENFPNMNINTITKEDFESLFDEYALYLNAWSADGIFLGTRVKTECEYNNRVMKLYDCIEAKNSYEEEPNEEFENFVKILRELIPDLPPLTFCIVTQIY